MQTGSKYRHLLLSFLVACIVPAFAAAQECLVVSVGEIRTYYVSENENSEYYWKVFSDPDFKVPASLTEVQFSKGNTRHETEIEWRKEGMYYIVVAEYDLYRCMNIKATAVKVRNTEFTVDAGVDTIIGACQSLELKAVVSGYYSSGFTFNWKPAEYLDDSHSATPIFTPGVSTRFTVTVKNSLGVSVSGTVQVTVSEVIADAGPDVFIYSDETAILDGSKSRGDELKYHWSTEGGLILSGAETVTPVIRGAGLYILRTSGVSGCEDTDTVSVVLLTYKPAVFDDYDTTEYRKPVQIFVLNNDHDPDHLLDPATLRISVTPMYGVVIINSLDKSIQYFPERNFSGTDVFKYSLCDAAGICYEASVHVHVKDFRFFIPEAFSPNNDGINDFFEIPGIEFYDNNSIEIFNRAGNLVYRTEKYGVDASPKFWDGKSNTGDRQGNLPLPTGTYFYVIDLGNDNGRFVGSVYLKR
jgi:gliding motility-associated-like protein